MKKITNSTRKIRKRAQVKKQKYNELLEQVHAIAQLDRKLKQRRDGNEMNLISEENNEMEGLIGYAEAYRASLTAVGAREHVLLLGPPGTAKSYFTRKFFAQFPECLKWETQLSKTADESQIFGIPNIEKLLQGEIVYPEHVPAFDSDFWFIDEMFDASDVLLRTKLSCLEERKFLRGSKVRDIKLHTAIATANYSRQNEVTAAVIDRFCITVNAPDLTVKQRAQMYKVELAKEKTATTYTLKQFSDIFDKALRIEIPPSMVTALLEMCGRHNFSARRERKLGKLIRVYAVLRGKAKVDSECLEPFKWALPLNVKESERKSALSDLQKLCGSRMAESDQFEEIESLRVSFDSVKSGSTAHGGIGDYASAMRKRYAESFATADVQKELDKLYVESCEQLGEKFVKAYEQA